jgi:hypothetical protein
MQLEVRKRVRCVKPHAHPRRQSSACAPCRSLATGAPSPRDVCKPLRADHKIPETPGHSSAGVYFAGTKPRTLASTTFKVLHRHCQNGAACIACTRRKPQPCSSPPLAHMLPTRCDKHAQSKTRQKEGSRAPVQFPPKIPACIKLSLSLKPLTRICAAVKRRAPA